MQAATPIEMKRAERQVVHSEPTPHALRGLSIVLLIMGSACASPSVPTATPAPRQFTLSVNASGSRYYSQPPNPLPLDSMLRISGTAMTHLGEQPVEVTLQTVELGERVSTFLDSDLRIYTTFGFVNRGSAPVGFDPTTVFAGMPAQGTTWDYVSIMDPKNSVHLEPNVPLPIRWRWRVSTRRTNDGATPAQTVFLTLNAPIDRSGPYVTISADSAVFRVDLPADVGVPRFAPAAATVTRVPTATALPRGTPLPRQ